MLLCAAPAWADDIVIGLGGPLTGPYAVSGEQMKRGAEQAVEDINAAGGINGQKLVLKEADDACDPKQAVTIANQFMSSGVKFVIGHYCSGSKPYRHRKSIMEERMLYDHARCHQSQAHR